MKKSILITHLGACLLSFTTLKANNESLKDSIIIQASKDFKVIILGDDLSNLLKYKRADSIKTLFMADWNQAGEKGLSIQSKETHYIVHPSGKRRFKAETEDFQEPAFNLDKETRCLNLGLPAYAYYLYDITTSIEIQIFIASPEKLTELNHLSINALLLLPVSDRYSLKRSTGIEIKRVESNWEVTWRQWAPKDQIEISSLFGAGLIGSKLSPEVGLKLAMVRADKHGEPQWSVGLSYNFNMLTEYINNDFSNISAIRSINAYWMMNRGGNGAALWKWIGLQAGYVHLSPGMLNNSIKVGLITTYRNMQLGFHTYFLSQKNTGNVLYGVSFNF